MGSGRLSLQQWRQTCRAAVVVAAVVAHPQPWPRLVPGTRLEQQAERGIRDSVLGPARTRSIGRAVCQLPHRDYHVSAVSHVLKAQSSPLPAEQRRRDGEGSGSHCRHADKHPSGMRGQRGRLALAVAALASMGPVRAVDARAQPPPTRPPNGIKPNLGKEASNQIQKYKNDGDRATARAEPAAGPGASPSYGGALRAIAEFLEAREQQQAHRGAKVELREGWQEIMLVALADADGDSASTSQATTVADDVSAGKRAYALRCAALVEFKRRSQPTNPCIGPSVLHVVAKPNQTATTRGHRWY